MNIFGLTISLLLALISCEQKNTSSGDNAVHINNSVVVSQDLNGNVTGWNYLRRAKGYFIVENGDTSSIVFEFSEPKRNNKVNIYFAEGEWIPITYRKKLEQLRQVLPEAAKDFKLDSLGVISIRTLCSNGDIAIALTEDFMNRDDSRLEFDYLESFMMDSKLSKDMNELFAVYSVKVKRFFLEKCHFSDKEYLLATSVIEKDSASIPNKILDCITAIEFEPIQ